MRNNGHLLIANEVYIWLAVDRNSRVVGCFVVGDRTRKSARVWASLPGFISNVPSLNFWQAYKTVIPLNVEAVSETGLTNHIERLNNTFQTAGFSTSQRKSIIFKKLDNYIGLLWYFVTTTMLSWKVELTTTSISTGISGGSKLSEHQPSCQIEV